MRKASSYFMLPFLLILCLTCNLFAGSLPNLEKALESWEGAKEVQIQGEKDDLLGSAEILPIIEVFLKYDFAVSPATDEAASTDGLLVEIRSVQPVQTLVVLKRASDNAIIAMERVAKSDQPVVMPPVAAQVAQPAVPYYPATYAASRPSTNSALIPLDGAPVSLVWLGESHGGGNLAVLSDAGVTLYQVLDKQLQKHSVMAPPRNGLRPLRLSRGDIDGDGSFELAAVWAEDHTSIYEGTDSSIWSQLFELEQDKLISLGMQRGYVRLMRSGGAIQQRGAYSPFSGPVNKLLYQQKQVTSGQPLLWGGQNIFAMTSWGDGSGLTWLKPGKLAMISLKSGELLPGGTLMENFGDLPVAQIAVRLEEPEYRSGFAKEDKVTETYVALPPRLARSSADSMLTIYRGRKAATLLFGQPSGSDQLVRLKKKQGELVLEYSFPPVQSFIIDFATMPEKDDSETLLLLNEKDDASGQAFLLYQHGS